jgi:hypothetical protein
MKASPGEWRLCEIAGDAWDVPGGEGKEGWIMRKEIWHS